MDLVEPSSWHISGFSGKLSQGIMIYQPDSKQLLKAISQVFNFCLKDYQGNLLLYIFPNASPPFPLSQDTSVCSFCEIYLGIDALTNPA